MMRKGSSSVPGQSRLVRADPLVKLLKQLLFCLALHLTLSLRKGNPNLGYKPENLSDLKMLL